MRRLILVATCLILTALPALFFVEKSSAQNADEIQKYIDAWLVTYQPDIESVETAYFKDRGQYWQGLATHTDQAKPVYDPADKVQPVENKTFVANCLECKPTDQTTEPAWGELFPDIVTKLPASMAIDTYDSPLGQGYVIRLEYCVDGSCYQQAIGVGPEDRSSSWIELKPLESVAR